MSIIEFLEARLAEDEAYARQAQGDKYGWVDRWRVVTGHGAATESVIMAHAFRLNPERMLAECAAKRVLIGNANHTALNALAAVYKNHPDYRQDWSDAE